MDQEQQKKLDAILAKQALLENIIVELTIMFNKLVEQAIKLQQGQGIDDEQDLML